MAGARAAHVGRRPREPEPGHGAWSTVAPGRATVSMPVTADMVNGHAIGHGGLTFAVADTAFAFACNSHGPVTVAHSADIRFHAPVHARATSSSPPPSSGPARSGAGCTTSRCTAGGRLVATFTGRSTQLRAGGGLVSRSGRLLTALALVVALVAVGSLLAARRRRAGARPRHRRPALGRPAPTARRPDGEDGGRPGRPRGAGARPEPAARGQLLPRRR